MRDSATFIELHTFRTFARLAALAAAAAVCVLGAPDARAAGLKWWDDAWPYRKILKIRGHGQRAEHGNAARLWIRTGGRGRPDGADIRVVGPDGPLTHDIRYSTPEGKHLLVFQVPENQDTCAVYFGNGAAAAPPQSSPPVGLILETRPIPEGAEVKDWPSARRALQAGRRAYGLDYWPRVFDGYNPFGPQEDYISLYRGSIVCPASGTYRFATVSDHSSFLLINDRPVASWVGKHDIQKGRKGEHSGRVQLSKGRHRFTYVHFAFDGNRRAAAAWIPPGKQWWEVIPPEAFAGPLQADVTQCERLDSPLCADFASRSVSYCESGDARMVAVRFESQSSCEDGQPEYRWDFGDGQVGRGATPTHVYFAPGVYDVALTVIGPLDRDTLRRKVRVEPVRDDTEFDREKLNRFAGWTAGYRLEALPTGPLLAAREFFADMELHDRAFRAALELDRRRDGLRPGDLYEVATYLGKRLSARGDHSAAERYFRLALQSAGNSRQKKFDATWLLAEHCFLNLDRPDEAMRRYRSLREDFPGGDPERRRKALIRMGDVRRNRGELEEARKAYEKAAEESTETSGQPVAVLRGRFTHDAEAYLREGKGQKALETVREWLWRFPTARLDGQPVLLKLRAWLLLGDYQRARKEAELALEFVSDPDYLAPIHAAAGEACLELGLSDEARGHFRTVINKFPESPSVEDARDGLTRLGGTFHESRR